MTLVPAPGSATPPIALAGEAGSATGRLTAPIVLLDDDFLARLADACPDVSLDPAVGLLPVCF